MERLQDTHMALRTLLRILFSVSLLIGNGIGIGVGELSKLEELNKKKQLEHHNKPAVKTIKTESGDVYECIDFYKQPAFDHPALKNHNFHTQMRPSSRPKKIPSAHTSSVNAKSLNIGLKDKACPVGTVPIRRVNEDDRIRIESLTMNYTSSIHPHSISLTPGTYVAIAQTKSSKKPREYHGVGANLSLHSPALFDCEYSGGQVGIQGDLDSIQVGWTVNPILYKDMKTRMFIYTNAGSSHCFNTYCPGFVIVREDIPLDSVLAGYTEPGGKFPYFSFFIYQDPLNGNWWLEVGRDYTPIGFWPMSIFTGLANSGSYVECGGQAYRTTSITGTPNMGTGFRPCKYKHYNAFCFGFFVVDQAHKIAVADHTEGYTNRPESYGVVDEIILKDVAVVGDSVEIENSDPTKVDRGSNIHIETEHRVTYGGPQLCI